MTAYGTTERRTNALTTKSLNQDSKTDDSKY